MKTIKTFLIVTTLWVFSTPLRAGGSFFDDFDEFDPARWFISDGWSNGDWMNCTWSRDAVEVRNGILHLHLQQADNGLECAEIQSHVQFGFGTYEVRQRTGQGSGVNAAFFTYIGPVHGRAHHEIDIEILLRSPTEVVFNTWRAGIPEQDGIATVTAAAEDEFHHYAFHWAADGITWFVDGVAVHHAVPPLPEVGQKIYASLWSSATFTDWMGPFDANQLPHVLEIDWIGFTALNAPCQFAQSILCGWAE
ncbi:MAG: family 16 glycosylhydrolase [Pseudomonadota bacterium]